MDPLSWSAIISSAVVPVVIISACGLLCLTFYNRLAFVVTRLRALQRERISEYKELFKLEAEHRGKLQQQEAEHFLHFLEQQTAEVLKRARYLRNTLLFLILSIIALIITSFFIAFSLYFPFLDLGVGFFFVVGLILLLCGLFYAIKEIRVSLMPVQMESAFVQRLIKHEFEQ